MQCKMPNILIFSEQFFCFFFLILKYHSKVCNTHCVYSKMSLHSTLPILFEYMILLQ